MSQADIEHVAVDAASLAAKISLAVRRSSAAMLSMSKDDLSPVTVADFACQAAIGHCLLQARPDLAVVAEERASLLLQPEHSEALSDVVSLLREHGLSNASRKTVAEWIDHGAHRHYQKAFWTVDPIDGTKGFIAGRQYAVAIALIVNGQPTVGVVACPALGLGHVEATTDGGLLFAATKGKGARCLKLGNEDSGSLVTCRNNAPKGNFSFCESVEAEHSDQSLAARVAESLGIAGQAIRVDSQCKYALVASGRADLYLRLPVRAGYEEKIWDHAAGALLVEEAGGRVSDITGTALDFSQGPRLNRNTGVVASNGSRHDQVIAACRRMMP